MRQNWTQAKIDRLNSNKFALGHSRHTPNPKPPIIFKRKFTGNEIKAALGSAQKHFGNRADAVLKKF